MKTEERLFDLLLAITFILVVKKTDSPLKQTLQFKMHLDQLEAVRV